MCRRLICLESRSSFLSQGTLRGRGAERISVWRVRARGVRQATGALSSRYVLSSSFRKRSMARWASAHAYDLFSTFSVLDLVHALFYFELILSGRFVISPANSRLIFSATTWTAEARASPNSSDPRPSAGPPFPPPPPVPYGPSHSAWLFFISGSEPSRPVRPAEIAQYAAHLLKTPAKSQSAPCVRGPRCDPPR
jgi:hypothetical protein